MKKILLTLALLVAIATAITWVATGASRGWTKTEIPVKTLDEVTGIEGITYQKKFMAGVDFLGAGLIIAGGLAGTSLFFRNKTKTNKNQN
ncbi:MAG TPA: hypothetical protein VGO57_07780 [Verrucomicrobiae bacterium]